MDLAPYVDQLRRELAVAAEFGGEDARQLAERLSAPLESAARLALLEALSAAADEITRELAPGSVDVRLRGRDADFVVTPPPPQDFEVDGAGLLPPVPPPPPPDADEGGTSRITLRLPEHLKPRIDEAAAREGLSVNAWLVRAVAAALDPEPAPRSARRPVAQAGQRFTGWVR
jgi:uncharacterized protein (DUF1778 family)